MSSWLDNLFSLLIGFGIGLWVAALFTSMPEVRAIVVLTVLIIGSSGKLLLWFNVKRALAKPKVE